MTRVNFTAVAERCGSKVRISFPDVPDVEFEVGSVIEGFEMAPGVLQAYIDRQAAAGLSIPVPAPVDGDHRHPAGGARFVVPVELPFDIATVTLNLNASLLERVDAAEPNRTLFFTRAAEAYLDRATLPQEIVVPGSLELEPPYETVQ